MAVTGRIDLAPGVEFISIDHDPTTVATDAAKHSIILQDTGALFQKLDDGSTTNVVQMMFLKDYSSTHATPGSSDDITQGWQPGSEIIDTAGDIYMCVTNGVGTATWKKLNA